MGNQGAVGIIVARVYRGQENVTSHEDQEKEEKDQKEKETKEKEAAEKRQEERKAREAAEKQQQEERKAREAADKQQEEKVRQEKLEKERAENHRIRLKLADDERRQKYLETMPKRTIGQSRDVMFFVRLSRNERKYKRAALGGHMNPDMTVKDPYIMRMTRNPEVFKSGNIRLMQDTNYQCNIIFEREVRSLWRVFIPYLELVHDGVQYMAPKRGRYAFVTRTPTDFGVFLEFIAAQDNGLEASLCQLHAVISQAPKFRSAHAVHRIFERKPELAVLYFGALSSLGKDVPVEFSSGIALEALAAVDHEKIPSSLRSAMLSHMGALVSHCSAGPMDWMCALHWPGYAMIPPYVQRPSPREFDQALRRWDLSALEPVALGRLIAQAPTAAHLAALLPFVEAHRDLDRDVLSAAEDRVASSAPAALVEVLPAFLQFCNGRQACIVGMKRLLARSLEWSEADLKALPTIVRLFAPAADAEVVLGAVVACPTPEVRVQLPLLLKQVEELEAEILAGIALPWLGVASRMHPDGHSPLTGYVLARELLQVAGTRFMEERLMEAAQTHAKSYSTEAVLSAVKGAGVLSSAAQESFLVAVSAVIVAGIPRGKASLGSVKTTVVLLSGSNGSKLHVDSGLVGHAIDLVLDRLGTFSPGAREGYAFSALLAASSFWAFILSSTGIPLESAITARARECAAAFFAGVRDGSLGVGDFVVINNHDHGALWSYCDVLKEERAPIVAALEALERLSMEREALAGFITRCGALSPADGGLQASRLAHVNAGLATTALRACSPELWGDLQALIPAAMKLHPFSQCVCAWNYVVQDFAKDAEDACTTLQIAGLVEEAIPRFLTWWPEQFVEGEVNLSVSAVERLFGSLHSEMLSNELDRMEVLLAPCSEEWREAFAFYGSLQKAEERQDQLVALIETFGLCKDGDIATTLDNFELCLQNKDLPMSSLASAIKEVSRHQQFFTDEMWTTIAEVAAADEVVLFVRETLGEDFRALIHAVDEQSNESVKEDSVSNLIAVARFLTPLLQHVDTDKSASSFFPRLYSYLGEADDEKIVLKLASCCDQIYGLRRLFDNIAKRSEVTRDVIRAAVEGGTYSFEISTTAFEVRMQYTTPDGMVRTCDLAELQDLHSRALLLANTPQRQGVDNTGSHGDDGDDSAGEIMQTFVKHVDVTQHIGQAALEAHQLGHLEYPAFDEKHVDKDDLQDLLILVQSELAEWKEALDVAREQNYALTFFHSEGLRLLAGWLFGERTREATHAVLVLVRFAIPSIEAAYLDDVPVVEAKPALLGKLQQLGEALGLLFARCEDVARPMSGIEGSPEVLERGAITVLRVAQSRVINVVMEAYAGANALPTPSQILFCRPDIQWEEVYAALLRCFYYPAAEEQPRLFCLANIERLGFDVQHLLCSTIRRLWNDSFVLVLICSDDGGRQYVLDEFREEVRSTDGIPNSAMRSLFAELSPQVEVFSSALPGMGKTESIKTAALALDPPRSVATIHLSGPLSRDKLESRLAARPLRPFEALHLDIGFTDDAPMLDTFLFELLIVANEERPTYLEVANTLGNALGNSLPACMSFRRTHIERSIDTFIVSGEVHSPVQVVCSYLHARHQGTLESTDIHFGGRWANATPVESAACRRLLDEAFFSEHERLNFTLLHVLCGLLASQLQQLSLSPYFRTDNLRYMGVQAQVRSEVLSALIRVAVEFATKSVARTHNRQTVAIVGSAQMVARTEGLTAWCDSNNLLVVLHPQRGTVTSLYRNPDTVPDDVRNLLRSQSREGRDEWTPTNFDALSTEALHEYLRNMGCTGDTDSSYVLTRDNLLKMFAILLRVQVKAPVVVMGETGCGKTSLVSYLAGAADVEFTLLNCHAGLTEEDVLRFIEKAEDLARDTGRTVWTLWDEINTCDHMGLMTSVVCHRTVLGRALHPNVVCLATCNPYRIRADRTETAGLVGKIQWDDASKLAYRVHPLPEALLDHVWDYGTLDAAAERIYIRTMVEQAGEHAAAGGTVLVRLITRAQAFMRAWQPDCLVSLRDVKRCIALVDYFHVDVDERVKKKPKKLISRRKTEVSEAARCIVLALGHCYFSRLPTDQRQQFCEDVTGDMRDLAPHFTSQQFKRILREEQLDFLARMRLEDGIAQNESLLENVFVTIVCILNRFPVFIVGKPGSSKSLSLQLINDNLRGLESRDAYFRTLPQVYFVSYQGSESSTSAGIIKVFDKAQRYLEHTENVLPVVVLDEIGLAEVSCHNPLKVLHACLEPAGKERPDVAVVGVSNWALDAAKMNRAIHLSRNDPDKDDLYQTALSIHAHATGTRGHIRENTLLRRVADAYHAYYNSQTPSNFHGLRDYYALVKSLARTSSGGFVNDTDLMMALDRNFGGLGLPGRHRLMSHFQSCRILAGSLPDQTKVLELLRQNLTDRAARNLLVVTRGNSALSLLEANMRSTGYLPVVIHGSPFNDDVSENYSVRILSRIILCMEEGRKIILVGLDTIYGALYDMLNQNYTFIGKKRNCRVALGAHSNPLCAVHDDFRCVIMVDESRLDLSDPPFLNRFEKQCLSYKDVLTDEHLEVMRQLLAWTEDIVTIPTCGDFDVSDVFPGYCKDTTASLVLKHSAEPDVHELLECCKKDLFHTATADGVARMSLSRLAMANPGEVQRWQDEYHDTHVDLCTYVKGLLQVHCSEEGFWASVITFDFLPSTAALSMSSIGLATQSDKLAVFRREEGLSNRIAKFFSGSDALLLLQCDTALDAAALPLARSLIATERDRYEGELRKHVCIVLRLERGDDTVPLLFHKDEHVVMLDCLVAPRQDLSQGTVLDALNMYTFEAVLTEELMWCFLCIQYPPTEEAMAHVRDSVRAIQSSASVKAALEEVVRQRLEAGTAASHHPWQVAVALDAAAIKVAGTLHTALRDRLRALARAPLAAAIYVLEECGALACALDAPADDLSSAWTACCGDANMFNIGILQPPTGHECYGRVLYQRQLVFPFSAVLFRHAEGLQATFIEETAHLASCSESGEVSTSEQEGLIRRLQRSLSAPPALMEYMRVHASDYVDDFLEMQDLPYRGQRKLAARRVLRWCMQRAAASLDFSNVLAVHAVWWLHQRQMLAHLELILTANTEVGLDALLQSCPMDESSMQQFIVSNSCDAVMPKPGMMLANWISIAKRILTVSSELLDLDPPPLLALRVCHDLAANVLIPFELSDACLPKLADLVLRTGLSGTEFINSLDELIGIVFAPNGPITADQEDALAGFRWRSYGRCLDVDPDDAVVAILHSVATVCVVGSDESRTAARVAAGAHVVVKRVILELDNKREDIFFGCVTGRLEPAARDLEAALVSAATIPDVPDDNPFAVMVCDFLRDSFFLSDIQMALEEGADEDDVERVADGIRAAGETLSSTTAPKLCVCASAALMAAFVTEVARVVPRDLPAAIQQACLQTFGTGVAAPLVSARMLLLKSLRATGIKAADIARVCEDANLPIPELKDGFGLLSPLWAIGAFKHAHEALWRLVGDNPQDDLGSMATDAHGRRAVVAAMAHVAWYPLRDHNDSEMQLFLKVQNAALEGVDAECVLAVRTVASGTVPSHFRSRGTVGPTHRALAVLLMDVVATAAATPRGVISLFATDPPAAARGFTPGAASRHARATIAVARTCACGAEHVAVEGMEGSSTCPQCATATEAPPPYTEHPRDDEDTSTPVPGFSFPQDAIAPGRATEIFTTARGLSPALRATLQFLVHSAVFVGATVLSAGDTAALTGDLHADALYDHVLGGFLAVATLIGHTVETTAWLLHAIIGELMDLPEGTSGTSTVEELISFEHTFRAACSPLLLDVLGTVAVQRAKARAFSAERSDLEDVLHETNTVDPAARSANLSAFFRIVTPPSLTHLRARMHTNSRLEDRYPFLSLFLRLEGRLPLVAHLEDLAAWTRATATHLAHRIVRRDADKPAATFLPRIPALRAPFERFTTAWNAVRGFVIDRTLPEMSEAQPLRMCLLEEGGLLLHVMGMLAGIQNNLIVESLALRTISPPHSVGVHQATRRNLVIYSSARNDLPLRYGQSDVRYGRGQHTDYMYGTLQDALVQWLLRNAAHLNVEAMRGFAYGLEAFHDCEDLLDVVAEVAQPQVELTSDHISALANDELLRSSLIETLAVVGNVLGCLKRTGGECTAPLHEYATEWLGSGPGSQLVESPSLRSITVGHVVSLYEALESHVAEIVVHSVMEAYTVELSGDQAMTVTALCVELPLDSLVMALRRLLFRHLGTTSYAPPTDALGSHIARSRVWPSSENLSIVENIVPTNLTLGHAYATYLQLMEKKQERDAAREREAARQRSGLHTAPPTSLRRAATDGRRRRARGKRGFDQIPN